MDRFETFKDCKEVEVPADFEMPACAFCYPKCGDCRHYENGWNGYCHYFRRRVSSSDSACGQYS